MKPPMIPHAGRGIDTVNFRNVKESGSVDISGSGGKSDGLGMNGLGTSATENGGGAGGGARGTGAKMKIGLALGTLPKGVPLDSGLATPMGEADKLVVADPFEEFNSVTLHHDGDEEGGHVRG